MVQNEMQDMMNAMAAAYRAGDAAACAAFFTPAARLFSPFAPPAQGREAIAALHRDWAQPGNNKQLSVVDAGRSGDLGWCLVAYSEGSVTGEGTSLAICERQPDGRWLISLLALHDAFVREAP